MKKTFTFLLLVSNFICFGQTNENSVCFVLNVKGDIWKPIDTKLKTGDTLLFKNISTLFFGDNSSSITIFEPTLGSFKIGKNEMIEREKHESLLDFIRHLFKIKGKQIPLSSRGECSCITASSCFYTDSVINKKNLLVDSLMFEIDNFLFESEIGFYYLQFKKEKKRLRINNGVVYITPEDLQFKDETFKIDESPEVILGIYRLRNGEGVSTLVTKIRFYVESADILREYYKALKTAMRGSNLKEIFDVFSADVYMYFGKPSVCLIEKIINSIK